MFAGIVIFSAVVTAVALGVFRKYEALERAEVSAYVALVAWGSLLFGLFIAKI
jgi:hypothetical protein